MEQRSFDAKRSRDQKRQRDRRAGRGGGGHHVNKTEETEAIAKPNISAVEENTRNSSSVIENKLSNEDKSKSEVNKEVDTASLFANLKRETDEITALTNKKYSKRQVFSNWSKYEEQPPAIIDEDTSTVHAENDFTALANAPASEGGSFKFKTEQSWDLMNIASMYGEHFALDLDILSQGLACIPFHDKLELPESIFSADEMERIMYNAKRSSVKYEDVKKSYVKSKKKQADDINQRITNILTMKDDNEGNMSQTSVYTNEEIIRSSQGDLTFDIVVPEAENVRESSPVENVPPVESIRKQSVTGNVQNLSPAEIIVESSPTANVQESSPAILEEKSVKISKKINKEVLNGDSNINIINKNVESLDTTVEFRNTRKSSPEIEEATNKNINHSNDVNDVLQKGKSVQENVKPSVLGSCTKSKETIHENPVVKTNESVLKTPKVIKLPTLMSKKEGNNVVKTEPVKPVENKTKKGSKDVKRSTTDDDDLDFLLSLKAPVKEVSSKATKAKGKTSTLEIEDDNADGKLPKLPPALQTEEDLDAWLDSALAD